MVIRFGRHLDDFERDRFASQFNAPDLPIPRVTEVGPAFGAWYAISTRAHGTPLEELGDDEWDATLPSLFRTLDALRSTDISATSGFGIWEGTGVAPYPSWLGYLASVNDDPPGHRNHGWMRALRESSVGDASFLRGYDQMTSLARDLPTVRHLVHNDLLYRNALAADGRIAGLFDWGCSIFGDFVYELALMVFWSPWYPSLDRLGLLDRARAHYAATSLTVERFDDRFRCCAIHIGLAHVGFNALRGNERDLVMTSERLVEFLV